MQDENQNPNQVNQIPDEVPDNEIVEIAFSPEQIAYLNERALAAQPKAGDLQRRVGGLDDTNARRARAGQPPIGIPR